MTHQTKGPGLAPKVDGGNLHIAIVHACWNSAIVNSLMAGARTSLLAAGVNANNIMTFSVPGSWELPLACAKISEGQIDVIIAIGVLIKGETMHFEYISNAVSQGLMNIQLEHKIPIVLGLLTVLDQEQAEERAGMINNGRNHGEDWGNVAVELGVKYKT